MRIPVFKLAKGKPLLILAIAIISVFSQSCTMVKIVVSNQRNPNPQSLVLDQAHEITSWGAIQINKAHFFPSSFQIRSGEKVIYIDPIEIANAEKADYIFITHAHPDHLSISTIKRLARPETVFICPKGVAKKLSKLSNRKIVVKPGDRVELDGLSCEAIAEYNTRRVFLWIKAHPRSSQNTAYILTLDNGLRLYHAGDTDYIPEMAEIKDIDVAMIPIGGDNLTMTVEEAAALTNEIKPSIVIPMHYELKNTEDLTRFKNLVDKNVSVEVLQ